VQARDQSTNHNTGGWSTTQSATTNAPGSGLIALWTFDDGSGSTAADSSGNGNVANLSGDCIWTTGIIGGALDLDIDDSTTVPTLQSLNLGTAFTFSLWVYPTDLAHWQQPILHGTSNWVQVGYSNCYFKSGGVEYGTGGVTANAWNHIVCVRFTDGSAKTYINNVPTTGANSPYSGAGNTFTVGGGNYVGRVDDVRVYNRSLDATEVNTLYQMASGDSSAPTPNPLTWATLPYATGSTSISMTATTASDPSGIEYFFDCTAGAGGHDSVWQDSTTYQDTGLTPSTQYTYRVQARDKSANHNTGGWSTTQSATTNAASDTTPPTPNPLTWATVPYATGSSSISMTATTASDPSGVEYFFDCTAGAGGHDSVWQTSPTYQDTGLTAGTQYSYRIQARDQSANHNTGGWSTTLSATTDSGTATLLAYWTFDDGSGSTAADSSGNGNVANLSGDCIWTTGIIGGALDLDIDDSTTVPTLQNLNLGTAFSFSLWVYPTDLMTHWQQPILHGTNNWVQVGYGNCFFKSGGVEYSTGGVTANAWNHIVCVRFTDGSAKTYINNVANTGANSPYSGAGNPFTVGGGSYVGLVDDVRVYSGSLGASEVDALYQMPSQDTTAPTPNPSTWATMPYATGSTSISMTATTASDPSGVQYYFDCTAGAGGHDSGWQSSATYQDTGLTPSTQYSYRIQTRDQSANQNTGQWSTTQSATTQAASDTTPPTPNPSTWATVPYATGSTSVSMTATTASDPSGVQYYFDCTAGADGHDSGWQSGATYQDTGLTPSTQYSYRVQTRDQSANQNTGAWSTTQSATTDAGGGTTVLTDGFETNFDKWTDGGATDWDRATDQKHTGSYSAHAGSADNDLVSDNLNTAGYSSMTIDFWYRDDDIDDADDTYLQLYNGSAYANRLELGNSTEDTWQHATVTVNNSGGDAAYFISNFRIKFEGTSIDSGENLWIDDVLITAQGSAGDPDLVAQWEFDDGSGSTAADSSGNGNTGSLRGDPVWTTGQLGGALEFDIDDDTIVSTLQSLNLGTEFSFTMWVYPTDLATHWQQPLRHGGDNWVQLGYGDCYFKSGGVQFAYSGISANAWTHIACVRQSSGTAYIYINGGSSPTTGSNSAYSGAGNDFLVGGGLYVGKLDDVRVYSRALTLTEIQNIMNGN
jgi:hypothetical protein